MARLKCTFKWQEKCVRLNGTEKCVRCKLEDKSVRLNGKD